MSKVPGTDASHHLYLRWRYRQKDLEASWGMGREAKTVAAC